MAVEDKSERFLLTLLDKAGDRDLESVIDLLIKSAKAAKYSEPVKVIKQLKEKDAGELKVNLVGCPLGEEGGWLNEQQIYELGLGYPINAIRDITSKKPASFPSRTIPCGERQEKVYWISFENVSLLEKKGSAAFRYGSDMRALYETKQQVAKLEAILRDLEGKEQQAPERARGVPGVWMTATDIKRAGSGLNQIYLGKLLKENESLFSSRRKSTQGRPFEGFITAENYQRLGLASCPKSKDTPTGSQPEVYAADRAGSLPEREKPLYESFNVNGKNVKIDPKRAYERSYVSGILSEVHNLAFTENTIDKVFQTYGGGTEQISGADFVKILRNVNGIVLLSSSSAVKKLESELGMSLDEVRPLLEKPGLKKFLHTLPGVIDNPYFLRQEIQELRAAVKARQSGLEASSSIQEAIQKHSVQDSDSPSIAIQVRNPRGEKVDVKLRELTIGWEKKLKDAGIMPPLAVYQTLLDRGILDDSSVQRLADTYPTFIEAMNGFQHTNLNLLAKEFGMEYADFARAYMSDLKVKGLVKDVATELKPGERGLYVIARGKLNDIRDFVKSQRETGQAETKD